jgi:hypothetical protein
MNAKSKFLEVRVGGSEQIRKKSTCKRHNVRRREALRFHSVARVTEVFENSKCTVLRSGFCSFI